MEPVIIGKEQDLPGCVNAPVLLQEIARACLEGDREPIMRTITILAEFAQTAVDLDHPAMKLFALRLGLFKMPSSDELKKAIMRETKAVAELLWEKVNGGQPKEAGNDRSDSQQQR